MEPITLILSALAAGALAGAQSSASDAVKDAYQGLKSLIQHKLSGKPEFELALVKHGEKPEVWKAPLTDALVESGIDKDDEIIRLAQQLITLLNSQKDATDKFTMQTSGNVQGVVQGDGNQVTMTFGEKKIPKK